MIAFLSGKKTYGMGVLKVLFGLWLIFVQESGGGFDSGQDIIIWAVGVISIQMGLAVIFLRMGQKKSEKAIIAAMKGEADG